jgi:hypothetical protein
MNRCDCPHSLDLASDLLEDTFWAIVRVLLDVSISPWGVFSPDQDSRAVIVAGMGLIRIPICEE